MAKRPRLRRPPGTFWIGQRKLPDPNLEPQRLSLYLPGNLLDLAQELANRAGIETVQEYCTVLLEKALIEERTRHQLEEAEARRGAFEGLHEIASDPAYLVEWTASSGTRDRPSPLTVALTAAGAPSEKPTDGPQPMARLSPAEEVILRHAGQVGDDTQTFLPALRRGEPVSSAAAYELSQALETLEVEYRAADTLPRAVAFALHRLAFESQILHTDAWPGSFDQWTVGTIRSIQELVERVLSGQDIRYATGNTLPESQP